MKQKYKNKQMEKLWNKHIKKVELDLDYIDKIVEPRQRSMIYSMKEGIKTESYRCPEHMGDYPYYYL